MEDPLADGLVDGGNGNLRSFGGGVLIAGGSSTLELFNVGLEQRLSSLVLLVLRLGQENSLLGRLDIGHENTSSAYRNSRYLHVPILYYHAENDYTEFHVKNQEEIYLFSKKLGRGAAHPDGILVVCESGGKYDRIPSVVLSVA